MKSETHTHFAKLAHTACWFCSANLPAQHVAPSLMLAERHVFSSDTVSIGSIFLLIYMYAMFAAL